MMAKGSLGLTLMFFDVTHNVIEQRSAIAETFEAFYNCQLERSNIVVLGSCYTFSICHCFSLAANLFPRLFQNNKTSNISSD